MAVAVPQSINTGAGTLGASHVTGSFTPSAYARVFCICYAYRDGGLTANEPTISDSLGGTWQKIKSVHTSNNTTKDMWLTIYMRDAEGGTPSGRTVTVSSTSATGTMMTLLSLNSYDITGVVVQTDDGEDLSAGDPAFGLGSAPAAGNIVLGAAFGSGANAWTPPSGYTEQADVAVLTSHRVETFYDVSSAAQTGQSVSTNTRSLIAVVELEAAPSITAPVNKVNGTHSAAASHTTASFSPDANTRLIATAHCASINPITAIPTITDSVGLTWTPIEDAHSSNTTTADLWVRSWISSDVGPSPAAMTVTVGATGALNTYCSVLGVLSAEINPTIVQTAEGEDLSAGDAAFTFASPTGGRSLIIAACVSNGNNGITPPTGFTETVDNIAITAREAELSYRLSGITTGPHAIATSNGRSVIIGFEIGVATGSGDQNLTPGLFTNTQTFYAPTVTRGDVTLTPGLFTNTQTFYAPALSLNLLPGLFTNVQAFFAPTVTVGDVTLTPGLFTNPQTFYGPTVAPGPVTLTPGLFTNVQVFYAPALSLNLLPGLFTNAQTFYAPTVTRGAVTLTPGLFTNQQTFYAPTVSQAGGPQTLTPGLLANVQTFYAPTVTRGAVTLTPSLFTNVQAFFAPQVAPGPVTITPGLFTNVQAFYAPQVAPGAVELTPGLFLNSQIFFPPTVSPGAVELTPGLLTNQQTFYPPDVTQIGAGQVLTPGLFTNLQIFYAPNVFTSFEDSREIDIRAVAVLSIDLRAVRRDPEVYAFGTAIRSYDFMRKS